MKKVKVAVSLITVLTVAAVGVVTGLSIWANKPRGVRIDINDLK